MHQTPRQYIPVFDVRTRCLSFGPRVQRLPAVPICVPLGDNLFRLDFLRFEMLCPPPPPPDEELSWADELPEWSWRRLPIPPFSHQCTPTDGPSSSASGSKGAIRATPSPSTRGQLPFKGPAHYDQKLDAWVGLTDDPATAGHLCSCQVPSIDDDGCWWPPAWKLSRESLFRQVNPGETHTGATLVYLGMGYKSRFCLVECLSRRVGSRRHLLRLTTLSLKYHKNGDLGTSRRRRVQSFKLLKPLI